MADLKTKTPPIELSTAYVTGNGIEDKFIVRAKVKKGSKEDKVLKKWFKECIDEMDIDIDDYDNTIYRELKLPDPDSKRNKKGKKVKDWIDTDYMVFTAKSGTTFPNGDKVTIPVYVKRNDEWIKINSELEENEKYIQSGSKAVIYVKLATYEVDGNDGVTAYLSKVQLTKPIIGSGDAGVDDVDAEEYDPDILSSKKGKKDKKGKKVKK